jgi:2-keto-4-pentenoate hydratase/2-oxohepta-3-ene-1,7-dioic acid hydratase in catechol pathway
MFTISKSKPYITQALYKIQIQSMLAHNPSFVSLDAKLHTREMIFNVPKTIAFLSQGTTLERGTLIMTGTGPGIGMARQPKVILRNGDDMRVYIQGIGTLINEVYYEEE